jgi:DNA-binding NarL/FixJ family response regulator
VLDFHMPSMDGAQVARVLMKEQPMLPVVICSGCIEEIPEWLRRFADACYTKGEDLSILLSAIEQSVATSQNVTRASNCPTKRTDRDSN